MLAIDVTLAILSFPKPVLTLNTLNRPLGATWNATHVALVASPETA